MKTTEQLKEYNRKYHLKYYLKNRKRILAYIKVWKLKNNKKYYQNHKIDIIKKAKQYYKLNKVKILKQKEYYRLIHKKEIAKKFVIIARNLYKTNIQYKIKQLLRRRILDALKGNPKIRTTMNLVGCSIDNLKRHLKKQFTPGMMWENYGKWHIDHIRPCAKFDLSKVSEQRKCFNYKNLQPLWAVDNLRKGDR